MNYIYGAHSDIGNSRRFQEDFMMCKEYGSDILAIIADGTGTSDDRLQPAVLAVNSIVENIDIVKEEADELFVRNPLFFLKRAMIEANNLLGVLKMANEEMYYGYASSLSMLYLNAEGQLFYAHVGNTRIYLLRGGELIPMTTDHTVAQEKLDRGELQTDYYATTDRLKVTSGLGLSTTPEIYVNQGKIKENDILVLTTDGVHYAIRPEYITSIILESSDPATASNNLVTAAKDVVQYPDNISAIVIAERK